jgi:hypothetical protein
MLHSKLLEKQEQAKHKPSRRKEIIKIRAKINDPKKKWATELNRTFLKGEVQLAKKHMKKCSPSLAIKEMQIKTTLGFYLIPVRIATIKNTITNKCW